MTELERMSKEIELDSVRIAIKQAKYQIAKCHAEIERYENVIAAQEKRISELEKELGLNQNK